MELISAGILGHHLLFDLYSPLKTTVWTKQNKHPTACTVVTVPQENHIHLSVLPSHYIHYQLLFVSAAFQKLNKYQRHLKKEYLSCAAQALFTLPYPERSYTTEPSCRWTLLQNHSIYQPAKTPSSYSNSHQGYALKSAPSPFLQAVRCSDISKGINTSHCCFAQPTWASELSAMGFVRSAHTWVRILQRNSFGEDRIDSSQQILLQGKCTLTLAHLIRQVILQVIQTTRKYLGDCQQPLCADGPSNENLLSVASWFSYLLDTE